MLVILANTICVAPSTVFLFYLQSKTVPMGHPKRYVLFSSLLQISLWVTNHYILPSAASAVDTVSILGIFLFAWLFAEGGCRLKSLVSMIVYMAAGILANCIVGMAAFPIAESLGYSAEFLVDKYQYANAVMCLICFFPIAALNYLAYLLLNRFWNAPGSFRWLLLFVPLPVSQILLLNLLNRVIPFTGQGAGASVTLILATAFCFAADVCAWIAIWKFHRAEQLKVRLQMTEEQLNTQAAYYRELQDNILAVNQIRHDLNNQLQAAYHLLETGANEQARSQLDVLQDSIKNRVGPRYCSNLMVDAVLAEKARSCRELGIRLDINANLPSQLPIENAHLCSAFSNLLDNSIQGAQQSCAAEKSILLRASVRRDCLIIHCVNSAAAPARKQSKDILRLHGLGLGILDRLASQYNGSLDTLYQNGEFDTTLILRFPE